MRNAIRGVIEGSALKALIKGYKTRLIDARVSEYLETFGAVCIEGPKWCGKTWTAQNHAQSKINIGDPEQNFQNRTLAELSPTTVLKGGVPHLIDEWQEVPPLWDAVRFQVDQSREKGLFILTGSSTPKRKGILHSGAGRIARLRMRPMSLFESDDSSGDVSLSRLFEGQCDPVLIGDVDLERLAHLIVRGGWPGGLQAKNSSAISKEYIKAILEEDAHRADDVKRNVAKLRLLLRSLARNESTTASDATLKKDIKVIDEEDIDSKTITDYLDLFNRLFLIDDQPPFAPSKRSSLRIKQSAKRHLSDPSLSAALLDMTETDLINDLPTFGFLFEALCERDLKIYAESLGGRLYHYQDYGNKEIDAIVELPDGRWGAFEIKLGANQIDAAAQGLVKMRNSFISKKAGLPPSFLAVICGLSNSAYQRKEDGVFVFPITALKP